VGSPYLEVGLVNTSKGPCNDDRTSVEAGLERSMLARTSLAIVLINNKRPWLIPSLVAFGYFRDTSRGVGIFVKCDIHLASLIIDSCDHYQIVS